MQTVDYKAFENQVPSIKAAVDLVVEAITGPTLVLAEVATAALDTLKSAIDSAKALADKVLAQAKGVAYGVELPILTNGGNEAVEAPRAAKAFKDRLDYFFGSLAQWNGAVANAGYLEQMGYKTSPEAAAASSAIAASHLGPMGLAEAYGRLREMYMRTHAVDTSLPGGALPAPGVTKDEAQFRATVIDLLVKIAVERGIKF